MRVEIGFQRVALTALTSGEREARSLSMRGSQVHSEEVSLSQSLFDGRTARCSPERALSLPSDSIVRCKFSGDREPILQPLGLLRTKESETAVVITDCVRICTRCLMK